MLKKKNQLQQLLHWPFFLALVVSKYNEAALNIHSNLGEAISRQFQSKVVVESYSVQPAILVSPVCTSLKGSVCPYLGEETNNTKEVIGESSRDQLLKPSEFRTFFMDEAFADSNESPRFSSYLSDARIWLVTKHNILSKVWDKDSLKMAEEDATSKIAKEKNSLTEESFTVGLSGREKLAQQEILSFKKELNTFMISEGQENFQVPNQVPWRPLFWLYKNILRLRQYIFQFYPQILYTETELSSKQNFSEMQNSEKQQKEYSQPRLTDDSFSTFVSKTKKEKDLVPPFSKTYTITFNQIPLVNQQIPEYHGSTFTDHYDSFSFGVRWIGNFGVQPKEKLPELSETTIDSSLSHIIFQDPVVVSELWIDHLVATQYSDNERLTDNKSENYCVAAKENMNKTTPYNFSHSDFFNYNVITPVKNENNFFLEQKAKNNSCSKTFSKKKKLPVDPTKWNEVHVFVQAWYFRGLPFGTYHYQNRKSDWFSSTEPAEYIKNRRTVQVWGCQYIWSQHQHNTTNSTLRKINLIDYVDLSPYQRVDGLTIMITTGLADGRTAVVKPVEEAKPLFKNKSNLIHKFFLQKLILHRYEIHPEVFELYLNSAGKLVNDKLIFKHLGYFPGVILKEDRNFNGKTTSTSEAQKTFEHLNDDAPYLFGIDNKIERKNFIDGYSEKKKEHSKLLYEELLNFVNEKNKKSDDAEKNKRKLVRFDELLRLELNPPNFIFPPPEISSDGVVLNPDFRQVLPYYVFFFQHYIPIESPLKSLKQLNSEHQVYSKKPFITSEGYRLFTSLKLSLQFFVELSRRYMSRDTFMNSNISDSTGLKKHYSKLEQSALKAVRGLLLEGLVEALKKPTNERIKSQLEKIDFVLFDEPSGVQKIEIEFDKDSSFLNDKVFEENEQNDEKSTKDSYIIVGNH